MGYITFTDEDGTVTIAPSYPAGPAQRFRSWTPTVNPIGPRVFALGTGRPYEFRFRADHVAEFVIPGVLPDQHADFMRFKLWALKGGTFEVYCDDADDNFYECRIAPSTEPSMVLEDAAMLEYAVTITARNIAGTPMLCNYRG